MITIRKEQPADIDAIHQLNLHSQWEEVPDEAFMAIIFNTESTPQSGGILKYQSEFDDAM